MHPPDRSPSGNGPTTHSISSSSPRSCELCSIRMQAPVNFPLPRLCQAILFLILGRSEFFISILGFVALGLESTLPIPQLIR